LQVDKIRKVYPIYASPTARLKEIVSFGVLQDHEEFVALEGVTLNVEQGTSLGLVGRNGAGKSTLLKIIAGNLAPTSGEVRVRGRLSSILELGMGFQPNLTGRQNLKVNGLLLGLSREELEAEMQSIIDFSELGDAIDWPLRTYSSGMFARLAFSLMTAVRSDVILLDEALATGDIGFAGKGRKLIHEFAESGSTVIVVSHNVAEIDAMCDRVVWLDKGKIIADGGAREVLLEYTRSMPHLHFRFKDPEPEPPDLTDEPTRLLFCLRAAASPPEGATYPIASAAWVDDTEGRVLGTCRPQLELHQSESLIGGRDAGLLKSEAERAWGEVVDDVRHFQPSEGYPIYLSIRNPHQSEGGNILLRIRYQDTQTQPLELSLERPGKSHALGTLFGDGDGEWREQDFPLPKDFGLFSTLLPLPEEEEAPATSEFESQPEEAATS